MTPACRASPAVRSVALVALLPSTAASRATGAQGHAVVAAAEQSLGASASTYPESSGTEVVDASTVVWETRATQGLPHARHEAALVGVGSRLYLLGGRRIQPVDIYDTANDTWSEGKAPPVETHHFQPVVREGRIWLPGANSTHGMIYIRKSYRNYHLRFEYKWGTKRTNNFAQFQYDAGCYYHVVNDKIWPTGLEYQIRYNHLTKQNHTGDFWSPKDTRIVWPSADGKTFRGIAGGGTPQPRRQGEHRAAAAAFFEALNGKWNRCEVIVTGGEYAMHKLNGAVVNFATNLSPGEGLIGFQAETVEIFYRNTEVREFPESIPVEVFMP